MGLSGTLDTFSVAEILGLLERARQTGALVVRGPEGQGALYLSSGRFCAGEAADWSGPVESRAGLDVRIVDVCFHLFGLSAGSFEFVENRVPSWEAERATDVGPIVERVLALRREWPTIVALVPDLDVALHLGEDLADDSLTLSRDAFRLLTLADGCRTLRQIAREIERSPVEVAAVAAELINDGALRVGGGPGAQPAPAPSVWGDGVVLPAGARHAVRPATESGDAPGLVTSVPDPTAALDREAIERERAALAARAGLPDPGPIPTGPDDPDDPAGGDVGEDADEDPDEGVHDPDAGHPDTAVITSDRGAILRMFSGLRDQT